MPKAGPNVMLIKGRGFSSPFAGSEEIRHVLMHQSFGKFFSPLAMNGMHTRGHARTTVVSFSSIWFALPFSFREFERQLGLGKKFCQGSTIGKPNIDIYPPGSSILQIEIG